MPVPLAYSSAQIALHWLIAGLVAFEILFSGIAERRWAARMEGIIPNEPMPNPHAIVGLLVLALTCWRLALRLRRGAPAPPAGEPALAARMARLAYAAFYGLLFVVPLSGLAAWWFGLRAPAALHGVTANVLLGLILVHAAAALAHRFWFKTDVLRRMGPGGP
jgi:cytochrome b561